MGVANDEPLMYNYPLSSIQCVKKSMEYGVSGDRRHHGASTTGRFANSNDDQDDDGGVRDVVVRDVAASSSTTGFTNATLRDAVAMRSDRNERRSSSPHFAYRAVPRIFAFTNDDVAADRNESDDENDRGDNVPPIEATGLALSSMARGAVSMSTIFLGPALLRLAKNASRAADGSICDDRDDDENNADEYDESSCRVYGMRPTSLLTNIGIIGGLLSCVLTPYFGSIIDHTNHRLLVGRTSALILSCIKGIEIFVGRHTWHAVSLLQVANMAIYNAYLVTTYSYTAELSRAPSRQTMYNARFQLIYYASMLAFLVFVMTTSTLFDADDVNTARISQTLAFATCAFVFTLSWGAYFRPRPALSEIPAGTSLARCGYDKLLSTIDDMRCDRRRRPLRLFLLSASLSEAATSALATISTTYMIHVLDMKASQIGAAFLCVFVAGVPGSKLGGYAGSRLNPLRSASVCLIVFVANTTLAAWTVRGPEDRNAMYGLCAVWGVCLAWLHPTHASLYCTIIPRGQEGEVCYIMLF
jgi:UMF1 family MFS transporter